MYGVWDGVTGVVRHPYTGAKYDGVVGFVEGLGKGAGGFILKDLAAVFGVPAYTMKGVHREVTKYRQPTAFIRRARQVEGDIRFRELTEEQRVDSNKQVSDGWQIIHEIDIEIQKTIKEQGVRGRYRVWQRRQWLREHGIIENVAGMQRALEAKRAGRDWEVEFKEELQRYQIERDKARQKRHDDRKRQYKRDENGRHVKSPDQRMKTQFRTHHALKKSAKKADKRWLKTQALPQTQATAPTKLNRHATDGPVTATTRPRARTHMASENDGIATVDHGNDIDTTSPTADDSSLTPPIGRSRCNSGDTLIPEAGNNHKIDASVDQTFDKPLQESRNHPLNVLSKDVDAGEQEHLASERGVVPRMTTA